MIELICNWDSYLDEFEHCFVDYHSILVADVECLLLHMLCMAVYAVSARIIWFFVCYPAGQIVK